MLFGRHVTKHGCAKPSDHGRADRRGDVIVSWGDIRGQRPQRVKRRFLADRQLLVHVLFNQMHRDMARALDHHLNIVPPGDFGQFSQSVQLRKLGGIIGIRNAPGSQSVPQREAHIILLHDLTDLFKMGIKKIFLVMGQAPFGQDGSTAGDNAGLSWDG